jgi:hypothetical protein
MVLELAVSFAMVKRVAARTAAERADGATGMIWYTTADCEYSPAESIDPK